MKTWLVTGASRGLGRLIAARALDAGDAVVATGRNVDKVAAALGEHERLLVAALDVTVESDAHRAAGEAAKRFGRIDVLVNNAGYGLLGAVEEVNADEVRRVFDTNVFGLLHVTRAVLAHMRRQGSGRIINFSSVAGYRATAGWGIYGATKFAVEAISEALSIEGESMGVRTTVIEPGAFRTDFLHDTSLVRAARKIDVYDDTVGALRTRVQTLDGQQPGDPCKLADAIIALTRTCEPPRRLPLGSDAVHAIEDKNRRVAEELELWRELSLSTDFRVDESSASKPTLGSD